jgi:hypothetical protein
MWLLWKGCGRGGVPGRDRGKGRRHSLGTKAREKITGFFAGKILLSFSICMKEILKLRDCSQ